MERNLKLTEDQVVQFVKNAVNIDPNKYDCYLSFDRCFGGTYGDMSDGNYDWGGG